MIRPNFWSLFIASPVFQGIADDFARAVDSAVSSLNHQFCVAVTVQIIHDERNVMSTRTDVVSKSMRQSLRLPASV